MSVLDDLIKIKTISQKDDLLKMIDEVSIYEKLSVDDKLKDLKSSEITRTKCPMLAAFIDGELYETVLADLVSNIYLQIEGNIPDVLRDASEKTLKQQKQIEILQKSIVHVEYHTLIEYDHVHMEDHVVAVFTKQSQTFTIAVIVVRETNGYKMFHGTYEHLHSDESVITGPKPVIVHGKYGIFTMTTYSVLGNNGYRFGFYSVIQSETPIIYDVMIGPDNILYLMSKDRVAMTHTIEWQEHNKLNAAKKNANDFAAEIVSIIESVM